MGVVAFVAAVVASLPMVATVLVSVASRGEDRAWTLAGSAPTAVQAVARRIVGLRYADFDWAELVARTSAGL